MPDRRNQCRQLCCGDLLCVLLLKHKRQNIHYSQKYARDKAFQEAERQRSAAYQRQRRQQKRAAAASPADLPNLPDPADLPATTPSTAITCPEITHAAPVVTPTAEVGSGDFALLACQVVGILSHLIGNRDPLAVAESMNQVAARGQSLAQHAAIATLLAPWGILPQIITRHTSEPEQAVPRHTFELKNGQFLDTHWVQTPPVPG